jgi:cell wall-associated NlpC family hydrolase
MTAFIELDAADIGAAHCRCTPCVAAARAATRTHVHPRRPLVRAAATTALVAVGGTVGGTGMSLAAASSASALAAPTHPGWDGQRYWFRSNGEWRWTSHYSVYQQHLARSGSTGAPVNAPLRQGWDGQRYWFQRSSDNAWRWTTHYDVYLRYTRTSAPAPTPTPPSPPGSTPPTSAPPTSTPPTTPPTTTPPPKGTAPTALETALAYASAQLGKPYVWGGNGPNGYDCSGLVQQSFLRAGVQLPRVAADQFAATRPITSADLRRGDLLFWSTSSRASGIHHVAIYLGGGRYIEAPRPGTDVRISVLSTGYWPTHFGRVVS